MNVANERFFHVTRIENRASIERFGLDWSRMKEVPGIAGSRRPEMEAVFLCEEFSVDFFSRMSETPVDVWSVDVEGLTLEDGPDGWWIVRARVDPGRLSLFRSDVPGTTWEYEIDNNEGGISGSWT